MTERRLTRGGAIVLMMMAVATVLAIWASPALAGTPGTVPSLVSTTHPDPATWYPLTNASFTWGAATENGGGATIAGYSFTFDQSAGTVPPVSSGAALSYLARVNYTVGSSPAEDRVADLNGDGKPDLVVENSGSNTVSVLLGNGDGTFRAAVSYATGAQPWSLQVGDVNGDGKLDIVTANDSASTVSVLLGNGDGTFQTAVNSTTGAGTSPECMRLGDLTGDGKLDIITANAGTNNISVLKNNGDGTFAAPVTYSTATHPTSIAVGDLNGDGKQDIVTANYATNNVSVLTGKGDGTFNAAVNYACGATPQTVELADCNGDNKLDIVVANYNSTASVLLNNGNGTFATNVDYATGSGPYSLSLGDLNHDGYVDIVTVNHSANNVSVLLGNGDGTFQPHSDYSTGSGPFWVALGDFNGDGYGDIAATNYNDGTVSVLLGSAYYRPASGKLGASFGGLSDGTWYLHVRAIDSAGKAGQTSSCQVNVDTVAPKTTASGLQGSATTGWANAAQTVTLTGTDATSGVATTFYTLDGVQHTYGGPFQVSAAGSHAITYWSVDKAGNAETAHSGYVNLDLTAPVTSAGGLSSSPTTNWHAAATSFTLSASDAGGSGLSATYYTIDGGARQTYGGSAVQVSGDKSHTVTFWSTDGAGNVESATTAYMNIDGTVPTTTASGLQTSSSSGWANAAQTVTLAATDATSGVATTYYTLDGVQHTYGGSFQVSAAGSHAITYWSVDNAGNAETVHSGYVNIDPTAPVTSVTTDPSGWTNGAVQVTLAASDQGGSGLASTSYQVGSGPAQVYSGPFSVSDATPVTFWSTDNAGNEEAHQTLTPQIDTLAPTTTATTDPSGWTNGSVTVTLSAIDQGGSDVAATYYKVGSGGTQTYDKPFSVSDATPVTYWSTDEAGNDEGHRTLTPRIDSAAPATTATTDPSGWTNGPVTVTLGATDQGGSGLAATFYRIGDGQTQTYDQPFAVSDATDVTYWSADDAGNEETHHTLTPQIETVAPVTTATTDPSGWTDGPVKVTLSASDQGGSGLASTSYQVGSGPAQVYSGPFSVSDATPVTFWSTDNAGNEEAHQTLTPQIETVAPLTTATTDPSGWTNGSVTVTLSAIDQGGSDVAAIYYKVGSGGTQTYDKPFSVSDATPVTYWSTDKAGNEEAHQTLTPQIDTTPPATTAATDPSGWTNGPVTVTLSATDQGGSDVATISYRIGDGAVQTYDQPFTVSDATPVTYWSTDNAGNEETHHTVTPQIETEAPVTTATTDPSGWTNGAVEVTLSATDQGGSDVAAISYRIGDGQTQTYDQPFAVSDATPVTYWSTDNAGNEEAHHTLTPQIDTLAPTASDDAPTGWQNTAQKVTISAADDGGSGLAALHCTLDGVDQGLPAGGGSFTVASDGRHTITYSVTDGAGNTSAPVTRELWIDSAAPSTTATTDPSGWTNGPVTVTLSATDQGGSDVAAISYCIGDGVVQTYDQPFTVSDATPVTYWSTDKAGNVEAQNTLTPQIDTVAPVTSSADLSAAGAAWQPGAVEVTLGASDAGSGVAATSYQVDGQGMQPYQGAFTVSGDGAHQVDFFSVDQAGNVEKTETGWVDIDSVGPTTTAGGLQDSATSGWTTQSQTVTLQASDAGAGMDGGAICYSIDGVEQPDYTAPFTVSGEGSHRVSYYAVDAAGNVGATTTGFVNIDTTAPVTTADPLVAGPDTGWVHDAQQVTLTAHDGGCGDTTTWYTLDGSDPVQYGGPFTVTGVQSHAITYWSVDSLGNREDAHTGYVNIAPDQALITRASGLADTDHTGWRNSPATIALATSGGGGTIVTQYSLDHGQWQTYAEPFTVSGDGSHQVAYRSQDDVGDAVLESTGYVNIDTTPPTVTAAAPATPQRADVVVVLTPSDAQSLVNATFYRIDKGAWTPGTSARVAALANHKNDGLHTVSFYAIDNAGNGDSALARQVTVRIDTTRPVFTLRSAKRLGVRRGHTLSLRLRARDAGGTCKLVVTLSRKVGKRVVKYTSTLSTRHVSSWQTAKLRLTRPRGTYTAVLRLRDPAGNLSAAKTIRVTIK